jgi:hypothetical protein
MAKIVPDFARIAEVFWKWTWWARSFELHVFNGKLRFLQKIELLRSFCEKSDILKSGYHGIPRFSSLSGASTLHSEQA